MDSKAIGIKVDVPLNAVRLHYSVPESKRPALHEIRQFATFIYQLGMAQYLQENDKSLGGNNVGNI